MKSKGYQIIAAGTIYNDQISPTAGIVESKLTLDHTTNYLYGDMVSITRDTAIGSGIYLTIPATGLKWIDAENGQTYILSLHLGVLKAEPV